MKDALAIIHESVIVMKTTLIRNVHGEISMLLRRLTLTAGAIGIAAAFGQPVIAQDAAATAANAGADRADTGVAVAPQGAGRIEIPRGPLGRSF